MKRTKADIAAANEYQNNMLNIPRGGLAGIIASHMQAERELLCELADHLERVLEKVTTEGPEVDEAYRCLDLARAWKKENGL